MVKGVDLRSTAGNCAWARTPQLTLTMMQLLICKLMAYADLAWGTSGKQCAGACPAERYSQGSERSEDDACFRSEHAESLGAHVITLSQRIYFILFTHTICDVLEHMIATKSYEDKLLRWS